MALLDVQRVLTRLYTDREFRERFFTDPASACQSLSLTPDELRQVACLDQEQVERFARSLKRKRLGLIRDLLPATLHMLGTEFDRLFLDYCDIQPSAQRRTQEALSFTYFLLERETDPFQHDVILCESLYIQVIHGLAGDSYQVSPLTPHAPATTSPPHHLATLAPNTQRPTLTPHACLAQFRYDMESLYPLLLKGEKVEPQPDPGFALIGKIRGVLRAKVKRINATTFHLLSLCDGSQTLEEIIKAIASELNLNETDRLQFAAECEGLIQSLAENGLIVRREP